MTHKEKAASRAAQFETHNEIITPNWRTSLSAGNASYNRNGNYWVEASPRRKRRVMERAMRKAGANHG